jgi:glycerophosphoryl diester phosphodiesterase
LKILGHRGARHEYPENTLGGIELALRAGVAGIEIDVHLTRDGHLVVIHDETVDRTTDGSGRVDAMTLAELQALDAGEGESVPTLGDVLDAVRGRAELLFVELKAPGCEAAVVDAIRQADQLQGCLVKSFQHPWVLRVKELEPELRTGCLLVGRPVDPVGLLRAARADALSVHVGFLDAQLVGACRQAGLFVAGWNCNHADQLPALRGTGVDWLGTDRPTLIVPAAASA